MTVRVGDLFRITLSDGRQAIGHYVFRDAKYGPLIQVFRKITNQNDIMNLQEVQDSGYSFPPIVTGLNAAVRTGLWQVIGKMPINNFTYPKFLRSHWNDKTGEVTNWFIYDGEKTVSIGEELPEIYKNYEYLVVWSPYDVILRIETGIVPFPYGEMIKNGRFTPRTY